MSVSSRISRVAAVLALCLGGSSCVSSIDRGVSHRPNLARIGAELLTPCENPVELPDRALTDLETSRLWGKDRRSLGTCGSRHSGLARAAEAIQQEQGDVGDVEQ